MVTVANHPGRIERHDLEQYLGPLQRNQRIKEKPSDKRRKAFLISGKNQD
jgi:hypothetical protein